MSKKSIWTIFDKDSAHRQFLNTPAAAFDLSTVNDQSAKDLFGQLSKIMKSGDGIGLAATQIGQPVRVVVIAGVAGLPDGRTTVMINPEITYFSPAQELGEEGCLSVPKVFGLVPRAKNITVRYFDPAGELHKYSLCDLAARVVQHEVDHLNGVLFISKVTQFTKNGALLK